MVELVVEIAGWLGAALILGAYALLTAGRVQARSSRGSPFRVVCSVMMKTCFTPATRSIAPPTAGTPPSPVDQFAKSPLAATCKAPRIEMSRCPPRIMAKLSA